MVTTYPSRHLAIFRAGKNDEGTAAGREELEQFVMATLHALIEEERNGPDGVSSLSTLCRVDVGLMISNGECNFFVSEIERTIGLGIFGKEGIPIIAEYLGKMWVFPVDSTGQH